MSDKRAMNNMDGDTKLTHIRLEAWGAWCKDNRELREYPEATLLHRVVHQGLTGAAQNSNIPIHIPEAVEVTEHAVMRLGEIDRKVIKAYYIGWAPNDILARRLRMRQREFENVLKRARWRISGYIAGYEERMPN